MHRIYIYIILCLLNLFISPLGFADKFQASSHIGKLPIQTWLTSRGTTVFFVHSPELPMLDLRLLFPAGSTEDASQFGVANLTNAILMTGNKVWNADQIAKQFDQWGTIVINNVNQDYAVVGLRSLNRPESLDPAIKLLSDILASPSFNKQQFNRLQKQTLHAIQASQQSPDSVVSNLFFKALYGQQGYGHPVLGTTQTVTELSRNDLARFYQQHYNANGAYFILVGNISNLQAKSITEQLSGALPLKQNIAKPRLLHIKSTPPSCEQFDFPSEQANILIGEIGITRNDPDFFPLMVGNHILGGGGLTSCLFQELRNKKGLVYSIYSGFIPLKEKGPFLIGLQSRNEKANEAIQTVHTTLSKFIKEGPSNEVLISAKRNLIGKFNVHLASNNAMTEALSTFAFYQLPLDYFDTYTAKIQKVTVEQIRDAMQRHLHLDQLITTIVGKTACPKSN